MGCFFFNFHFYATSIISVSFSVCGDLDKNTYTDTAPASRAPVPSGPYRRVLAPPLVSSRMLEAERGK